MAARTKFGLTQGRDLKVERDSAQESLFTDMMKYGDKLTSGAEIGLVQIAHALILCGLPYKKTAKTSISRQSRAADRTRIQVTFHALGEYTNGSRIPMAYGSDRTLLHWCVDKAAKGKDPFIPMSTAVGFLHDTGQTRSGANYTRLRASYERIASLAIVVERFCPTHTDRAIVPILAQSSLPSSIRPGVLSIEDVGKPLGIRFGTDFFAEISANHVPFPWEVLRNLAKKPQMQDAILFLHWRSYAARSDSFIPWDRMREQIWHDDTNPWRIRGRFVEAIALMKTVVPRLNAEAEAKGLRIGPSEENLLPVFNKRRRAE